MAINLSLLAEELTTAGVPFVGVSEANGGRIDYTPEATQNQRDTGAAVLAAHNPNGVSQSQHRALVQQAAQDALKGALITPLLQSITDDDNDIAADLVTVNGLALLPTLTQFKLIIGRILARQHRIEDNLARILKILSHE